MRTPLKVSRILHAGYLFECGGSRIVFDPLFENPFSQNCFAYPDAEIDPSGLGHVDAVFISHYHDDHFSLVSLDRIDRATPIYFYCIHEELFGLLREMGFENVSSLELGIAIEIGTIRVTPKLALDPDVDSIFQVSAAGVNVLNVVDSWIDPLTLENLAKQAPWDLVLWPFQTMQEIEVLSPSRASPASKTVPEEWLEQLARLAPRAVVPSSCQFIQEPWSWYRTAYFPISYAGFEAQLRERLPGTRYLRLDPGCSIELSTAGLALAERLPWVEPRGPQDVDYEYDPEPMSTSEIAKRFPALTDSQTARVLAFCETELGERLAKLPLPEDNFFAEARPWGLTLYDHEGRRTEFSWILDGNRLLPLSGRAPEWRTELPIQRLFGAFEEGESLSSMYVRINEGKFPSAIEEALKEADIMEDPLLRALFNGRIGSYQRAQLAHLR